MKRSEDGIEPGQGSGIRHNRWTLRTWKPYERKRPRGRPARRWKDELDDYWKGTIWQRVAQDRQMWRQHAEAVAQQWDTIAAQWWWMMITMMINIHWNELVLISKNVNTITHISKQRNIPCLHFYYFKSWEIKYSLSSSFRFCTMILCAAKNSAVEKKLANSTLVLLNTIYRPDFGELFIDRVLTADTVAARGCVSGNQGKSMRARHLVNISISISPSH